MLTRAVGALLVLALLPTAGSADCARPALPPPTGPVIEVGDLPSLLAAVRRANVQGNLTIALRAGEYLLQEPLTLIASGITVRGRDGERERVVLRGAGMDGETTHIFDVYGDETTIADLTAGEVSKHVVEVHAERDVDGFHAHNVRLVDSGLQIFKVGYERGGAEADHGVIEWSEIEFTRGHAPRGYAGGIGAIGARHWIVRHNLVRNIRVPPGAEPALATAIQFRRAAEGNRVESNVIVNCDIGIRFGLFDAGHGPGVITNNRVHAVTDVGIGLERASGVIVAHNTVWATSYPNAIEYRFPESRDNLIVNNLAHGAVQGRDGAQAIVAHNVEYAAAEWFAAPEQGDLRLTAAPVDVVDRGRALPMISQDLRCQPRSFGGAPDIGADEVQSTIVGSRRGDRLIAFWNATGNAIARAPRRLGYRALAAVRAYAWGLAIGLLLVWALAFGWLVARDRRSGCPHRYLRQALLAGAIALGLGALGLLVL